MTLGSIVFCIDLWLVHAHFTYLQHKAKTQNAQCPYEMTPFVCAQLHVVFVRIFADLHFVYLVTDQPNSILTIQPTAEQQVYSCCPELYSCCPELYAYCLSSNITALATSAGVGATGNSTCRGSSPFSFLPSPVPFQPIFWSI